MVIKNLDRVDYLSTRLPLSLTDPTLKVINFIRVNWDLKDVNLKVVAVKLDIVFQLKYCFEEEHLTCLAEKQSQHASSDLLIVYVDNLGYLWQHSQLKYFVFHVLLSLVDNRINVENAFYLLVHLFT